jgi:hypothetical protein
LPLPCVTLGFLRVYGKKRQRGAPPPPVFALDQSTGSLNSAGKTRRVKENNGVCAVHGASESAVDRLAEVGSATPRTARRAVKRGEPLEPVRLRERAA